VHLNCPLSETWGRARGVGLDEVQERYSRADVHLPKVDSLKLTVAKVDNLKLKVQYQHCQLMVQGYLAHKKPRPPRTLP